MHALCPSPRRDRCAAIPPLADVRLMPDDINAACRMTLLHSSGLRDRATQVPGVVGAIGNPSRLAHTDGWAPQAAWAQAAGSRFWCVTVVAADRTGVNRPNRSADVRAEAPADDRCALGAAPQGSPTSSRTHRRRCMDPIGMRGIVRVADAVPPAMGAIAPCWPP